MKKPTKRNGFTLVELIIVIAILAILATVGLQVFGGIQENARKTVALSDARMAAEAMNTYYQAVEPSIRVDSLPATRGTLTNAQVKVLYALLTYSNADENVRFSVNGGAEWPALANVAKSNHGTVTPSTEAAPPTVSAGGTPDGDDLRAFQNIYYDTVSGNYKPKSKTMIQTKFAEGIAAANITIGEKDELSKPTTE